MKWHITGCTAKHRQVSFLGPSHSDTAFLERPCGLMVVLGRSFSCCWPPSGWWSFASTLHWLCTVFSLLLSAGPVGCRDAVDHLWRQREPSQHLKAVWIGLSSSPLTPEGAVVFQLLSELDGLGLCLQLCYRGKLLKCWIPLFIAQSPVLYESGGPVELKMDRVLPELLCYRDGMQASRSQAGNSASCALSVWDLG